MIFNQNIKDLNRVIEIIQVFRKYRLEELIFIFRLGEMVPKEKKIRWAKGESRMVQYSLWERIRMAFEELGPAFVKLGQVLSNRKDILPEELILEFEKLQSSVAPFPFEEAQKIVELETKTPLKNTFKYFSKTPLASASIGQVHKAVLPNDHQVVVKVQRPGVQDLVKRDLSVLKRGAKLSKQTLEKRFGITNVLDFVEEFEKTMQRELKYSNEARNIRQFRDFYKNDNKFHIPNYYDDLSTDKILVMEFAKGCKITDVDQLQKWGLDPEVIAEKGMDIYMSQMFEHGYFHADPHPGNIIIQEDGTICLIDFGMVGRLSKNNKFAFASALISMARQDSPGMARHFRKLATYDEITNPRAFEQDLGEIIDDFSTLTVEESNIADLGMRLQKVIYKYKMKVPGSLFLLIRSMAILEGIGKTIHPTFNTYEYLKPYGKKLLMDKFSKENILEEALFRISRFDYFIRNFPLDIQEILRNIRKGKLHLEIEHSGYESGLQVINKAFNRLMLTLIIVGLLIASAIIMMAPVSSSQMTKGGIPILSIIGFILASVLSLVLWFNTSKSNKIE